VRGNLDDEVGVCGLRQAEGETPSADGLADEVRALCLGAS